MRILITFLMAAAALGGAAATAIADDVTVTEETKKSDRLIELTIETPAFTEPTKVHVFLPTGYDADQSKRWPVTYVLAGTMNNYNSFANLLNGEEVSKDFPSIIVSPDGNSGYWSDWYNSGAFGPPEYETYVIDQLIPLIDSLYRTSPDRQHRAVVGVSMGGYGSLMYAARHPDLFGAAASISGAIDSNLPLLGSVLSVTSTFDGGAIDAIYGPRTTQEVRWHGHNPADLAENLRATDLQVRTANGILNPEIGEGDNPADLASCVVENGVYQGSTSFHGILVDLGIDHLWKDYGNGCHTPENFNRETVDTLAGFTEFFANPPAAPTSFNYRTINPHFDIYGWKIDADPQRALEFMKVKGAPNEVTLEGSGHTTVASPPGFKGLKAVDVNGTPTAPGADGRVTFTVDLGPAHKIQQYTLGAATTFKTKKVTLKPHALLKITRATQLKSKVTVCFRTIGGTLPKATLKTGKKKQIVAAGPKTKCRTIKLGRKVKRANLATIQGLDTYGHMVKARAAVRHYR